MKTLHYFVAGALGVCLLSTAPAGAQAGGTMVPLTPNMKKFDLNHDGVLDAKERAAMWKALQATNPTLFKKFDKNGDGVIDAAEEQAAYKLIQARVAREKGGGSPPRKAASKGLPPSSDSAPGATNPSSAGGPGSEAPLQLPK